MTTLVRLNARRWTPIREAVVMQDELSRLINGSLEGYGREAQTWALALDASLGEASPISFSRAAWR